MSLSLAYDPRMDSLRSRFRGRGVRVLAATWFALTALGASACDFALTGRAEARDEWRRSYKVTKGGTFEIRNTNGQIRVEPAEGDTVELIATRIVRAPTEEQAKRTLEEFKIAETVSADSVLVDSTGLRMAINRSRTVDYLARVPAGIRVTLKSTNGDIDAKRIGGMFRAESTNGGIRASAIEGGAQIETTNGNVDLDVAGVSADGIRCSTTNGTIAITLPQDVKAQFTATVTNGDISTKDLPLATKEQTRKRLEATAGGGGPSVRLSTTNGDIRIRGR